MQAQPAAIQRNFKLEVIATSCEYPLHLVTAVSQFS